VLAHPNHFGVAPQKLNIARAWDIWGVETTITAFVGDQYSNPVRTGTSVYFTSSAGIIGGSSTTSPDGRASIQLISGPPQPAHPDLGDGYVIITGSTADRLENEISDDAIVLFSGTTRIVVPPPGPIVKGAAYDFFVYDQNQNPLAQGTTITITASGTNVEALGNTDVLLSDNLYGDHNNGLGITTYGITRFSFGYQQGDATNEQGIPVPDDFEAVTIRVLSPNGNTERVVLQNGSVRKRDEAGKLIPVTD
jgi:hypothetical protein